MFGSVTNPANENLPDLNGREYATLVPLMLLAFWIGLYPAPLFRVLDQPVRELVQRYDPNYYHAPSINAAANARAGGTPAIVLNARFAPSPGRVQSSHAARAAHPTLVATAAAEKQAGN
jgi:hypothetical protein